MTGHYKPIFPLAAQILTSRPNVIITVLTQVTMYTKLLAELDKLPLEVREDARTRFESVPILANQQHLLTMHMQRHRHKRGPHKSYGTPPYI